MIDERADSDWANLKAVAPFTGAWIEIFWTITLIILLFVAPFTGAWIEMAFGRITAPVQLPVAPFTGAWIEITRPKKM